MNKISVVVGADIVPTETNFDFFAAGDADSLFGAELKSILANYDFRMFNLEVPLTDNFFPIMKCGPNLIAPAETINGIKAINPTVLTLGNNHILDQGELGLNSTIALLKKYDIAYVGAGKNLEFASRPHIIEKNGLKIGTYACAEHEFSIATENSSGANPFEPLESLDHIVSLKTCCNYVIVLYHGGKEHFRYPSPYLQKVCRKMIEKGADLVVCQHTHCIGCEEKFLNGTIIYGQGNFLFDHSESEYWKTSLLIELNFNIEQMKICYIPIAKKENVVRLADETEAMEIMKGFYKRSEEIKNENFVESNYKKFADSMIASYYRDFVGSLGKSIFFRMLDKMARRKLSAIFFNNKQKIILRNKIECEAHRELILKGLE